MDNFPVASGVSNDSKLKSELMPILFGVVELVYLNTLQIIFSSLILALWTLFSLKLTFKLQFFF